MPRHLHQKRPAVRTDERYEAACSLDRINGEHSPLDTMTHERGSQFAEKTYSHIINLPPMSTCAVDTPLIPHLSPSSCNERKRCGIGFGGRLLLCVLDVVCFGCCVCVCFSISRGAEQVVMQMTSKGINPFSAPRTPVPLTQFNKQAAGRNEENESYAAACRSSIFAEQL